MDNTDRLAVLIDADNAQPDFLKLKKDKLGRVIQNPYIFMIKK
jgi:uncharacterized membrane protein